MTRQSCLEAVALAAKQVKAHAGEGPISVSVRNLIRVLSDLDACPQAEPNICKDCGAVMKVMGHDSLNVPNSWVCMSAKCAPDFQAEPDLSQKSELRAVESFASGGAEPVEGRPGRPQRPVRPQNIDSYSEALFYLEQERAYATTLEQRLGVKP